MKEPSQLAMFGGSPSLPYNSFVPWPAPTNHHIEVLARVIKSGKFHRVNHPLVEEVETRSKEFCNTLYCRATSSGSAAIHIATDYFARNGNSAVLCALNWPGAVAPIATCGLEPIFVDANEEDACLLEDKAITSIRKDTAFIQVTHLFGNCATHQRLRYAAKQQDIDILDDCAQSVDTPRILEQDGLLGGSAYVLSGNGAKHLSAGELGLLNSNSLALIEHVDQVSLSSSSRNGDRVFSPLTQGYNYRPNVFSAAIATDRLSGIEAQLWARRSNVSYLLNRLEKLPGIRRLFSGDISNNSFCSFPMRFDFSAIGLPESPLIRDRLVEILASENIPIGVWLRKPVWDFLPAWRGKFDIADYPNTRSLLNSMFYIVEIAPPNDQHQMQLIVDAFEKVWDHLPFIRNELLRKTT